MPLSTFRTPAPTAMAATNPPPLAVGASAAAGPAGLEVSGTVQATGLVLALSVVVVLLMARSLGG